MFTWRRKLRPLRLLPTNSEEGSEEYIETPKGKVKQASPLWQLPTIWVYFMATI